VAAVDARGLVKRFGGQPALRGVDLRVAIGSCHGLLGENGAGKSTLGRVIAGVQRADAGELSIFGEPARWSSPRDALAAGVAMVHQELAFCPELSVAENLHLGRWPTRAGFVQRRAMHAAAREALAPVGLDVDPSRAVASLSTAQEQLLQIAQALASGARLVVFDEPTSSLDEAESALARAVRRDPENFEGWANLAEVRRQMGDRDGAGRAYEKALQLRPGDSRLRQRSRSLGSTAG